MTPRAPSKHRSLKPAINGRLHPASERPPIFQDINQRPVPITPYLFPASRPVISAQRAAPYFPVQPFPNDPLQHRRVAQINASGSIPPVRFGRSSDLGRSSSENLEEFMTSCATSLRVERKNLLSSKRCTWHMKNASSLSRLSEIHYFTRFVFLRLLLSSWNCIFLLESLRFSCYRFVLPHWNPGLQYRLWNFSPLLTNAIGTGDFRVLSLISSTP